MPKIALQSESCYEAVQLPDKVFQTSSDFMCPLDKLRVGDRILQINGLPADVYSQEQINALLFIRKETSQRLVVNVQRGDLPPASPSKFYVRALFSFCSKATNLLGPSLQVEPGDLLKIVESSHPNWWQAYKLPQQRNSVAGLIPTHNILQTGLVRSLKELSKQEPALHKIVSRKIKKVKNGHDSDDHFDMTEEFQCLLNELPRARRREERPNMRHSLNSSQSSGHSDQCPTPSSSEDSKKKSYTSEIVTKLKKLRTDNVSQCSGMSLINVASFLLLDVAIEPFERVVSVGPFERRSLLLLGAPGVGKRVVKRDLVKTFPAKFAIPIACTDRPKKSAEIDADKFHFLSKDQMENLLESDAFVECVRHKNFLYGMTNEAIDDILNNNKIPVLDLEPECLPKVRNAIYRPL
ncbi:membrane protein, palmitoylated 4 (MAGUK p55 subfamily member 4), partial [Cichlidogyrus casuarinus]